MDQYAGLAGIVSEDKGNSKQVIKVSKCITKQPDTAYSS